ncbi:hypothetical protein D3C72_876720 [compost metagenome]
MRHGKALISIGLLCASLALVGCNEDKDSKISPKRAGSKMAPASPDAPTDISGTPEKPKTSTPADPATAACYQDLCKDMQGLTYEQIYSKAANPTPEQQAYYKQNFESLVKNYVKSLRQSRTSLLALVQKNEAKLTDIELSKAQLNLVKAVYIYAKMDQLSAELQAKLTKKYMTKPFFKANFQNLLRRQEPALKILYPELIVDAKINTEEALKQEGKKISGLLAQFKKFLGFNFMSIDSEILEKAQNGLELSANEIYYLLNRGYILRYIDSLATGEGKELTESFDLTDKMISELYQSSFLNDNLKNPPSEAKELGRCEGRFYQGLNLYPSSTDIKNFKKLENKIIQAVSDVIPSSDDKAQSALNRVVIGYPKNTDELVSDWQEGLIAGAKDEIADTQEMKQLDPSALKTMIIIKAATQKKEISVCDSLISTEISDMNVRGTSLLRISWFSIRFPEYGIAVLAHELGHVVHDASTMMDSQKKCLRDRQPDHFRSSPELSGDNQGEDFADMIAAKVINRLGDKLGVKSLNVGCFFASAETDEYRTLVNKREYDPHSSGLFRALSIATGTGEKIPASCEQLAASEKSKVLNRCE